MMKELYLRLLRALTPSDHVLVPRYELVLFRGLAEETKAVELRSPQDYRRLRNIRNAAMKALDRILGEGA